MLFASVRRASSCAPILFHHIRQILVIGGSQVLQTGGLSCRIFQLLLVEIHSSFALLKHFRPRFHPDRHIPTPALIENALWSVRLARILSNFPRKVVRDSPKYPLGLRVLETLVGHNRHRVALDLLCNFRIDFLGWSL